MIGRGFSSGKPAKIIFITNPIRKESNLCFPCGYSERSNRVAERIGFVFDRQKGSHAVYYRPPRYSVCFPGQHNLVFITISEKNCCR